MTAGHLDKAERAYRSVLSIEPTDEAALEGLVDIERLRRIETDGVSSTDWQQQYAAGADESIDLPPMLSSDIFETLSTDDTEPPSIPVEAQTVASSAADPDSRPGQANQDAYPSIQHVAAADETDGSEPENPWMIHISCLSGLSVSEPRRIREGQRLIGRSQRPFFLAGAGN